MILEQACKKGMNSKVRLMQGVVGAQRVDQSCEAQKERREVPPTGIYVT